MSEKDIERDTAKARAFFTKAEKLVESGNFDYAIEMYLEGLACDPNDVEHGHVGLRELALRRQQKGGKKPSMIDKLKHKKAKTHLAQMLNAEYLLAKDPDNLSYAEALLKAAVAGDFRKAAKWIADFLFMVNNSSDKPSANTFLLLKDCYSDIGSFDCAIVALRCAVKLKPADGELADEFKRLEAERTVAMGKYDQQGDFRQSIKDRKSQEKLHAQSGVVKTEDFRVTAVEDAKNALKRDPGEPKNIFKLAQALSELETDEGENEAVDLLNDAYESSGNFSFKQSAGLIRIKQAKRHLRKASKALGTDPCADKAKVEQLTAELNKIEMDHYKLCVENYPTDLAGKYEYGVRLLRDKRYDDAIPMLQEAQRDPRRKIPAMSRIGLCFFHKGWFSDAIDVFLRAIELYEIKDDAIAKDLRYNLARAYEDKGDKENALELYRKLAQLDFAYKDVRKRVDNLRNNSTGPTSQ